MKNEIVKIKKETGITLNLAAIESALIKGDLSKLSDTERVSYYNAVCESLGLNPLTRPFEYIILNGKLMLYTRKDATEQLRKIHKVSITEMTTKEVGGVFCVTVKAQDGEGRLDMATGAMALSHLKGEAMANALMKAETKAKRRVTLSICGLNFMDESEFEREDDRKFPAIPEIPTTKKIEEINPLPFNDEMPDFEQEAAQEVAGEETQVETWTEPSGVYFQYNLETYTHKSPEHKEMFFKKLAQKKGVEVSLNIWEVPELIEGLKQYLIKG